MKLRFKHYKPDDLSVWSLGFYVYAVSPEWWGAELYIGRHMFSVSWSAE